MSDSFPDGRTCDSYIGTIMTINFIQFQIKERLFQKYFPILSACRAVFTAVRLTDNRDIVLVLRVL
jgi:hypothetical protein